MDFVRDIAIAYIKDDETYVSTISIPKKDLDIRFAASPEGGFPKVIDRDGYAVLYNDRDGYEAWELTLFDLNKNPIVVPVMVLKELHHLVVDDLRHAVGKLEDSIFIGGNLSTSLIMSTLLSGVRRLTIGPLRWLPRLCIRSRRTERGTLSRMTPTGRALWSYLSSSV